MVNLKALQSNALTHIEKLQTGATEFLRGSPIVGGAAIGVGSTIGAVGLVKGVGAVVGAAKKRKKAVKKRRKTTRAKRKTTRTTKRVKRRRYTPRTAGKGKDRSTRRIRQTKNGQPYIILKSGKARFIKRSSARLSRKRKGGRY